MPFIYLFSKNPYILKGGAKFQNNIKHNIYYHSIVISGRDRGSMPGMHDKPYETK